MNNVVEVDESQVKTGWKVVSRKSWGLISFMIQCPCETVEYKINEWVYPNYGCGPLCVFDTLENATNFLKDIYLPSTEVYQCLYVPSAEQEVWLEGMMHKIRIQTCGTQFAKSVRLILMVKEN